MELFQRNGQLDEDVEDILYELGNVGVGMVSTTIGSMLGVRAEIGIPVITKADMHIVEQIDKKQTEKIGIYLNFANTLNGAVLLLSRNCSQMRKVHQPLQNLPTLLWRLT